MKYSAILAAAAAVLGTATVFSAPVAAQDSASVTVRYSDLDLSTQSGQESLDRRIDKAARSICGVGDVTTGSRLPSGEARQCYEQAKSRVHDQVAERIARNNNRG